MGGEFGLGLVDFKKSATLCNGVWKAAFYRAHARHAVETVI